MGKNDEESIKTTNIKDVEAYFTKLRKLIGVYRKLNSKLDLIKADKKKVLEKVDLINERQQLHDEWLTAKKAARSNIKLLKDGLDVLKEKELREIQDEFREIDGEFKAMGVMVERESLFEGARAEGRKDKFDPKRATNDDLIDKALETEKSTLAELKQGLATVETTKEIGKFTAAQLQQDTEKMKRIDQGLNEVQSEAALSQVLITRFAKRMATDKIVIAFAFVLIGGLVGIIVYASLNPDQKIFNVPSAVRPNFSAAAAAASQGLALLSASSSPTPSRTTVVRRMLREGESADTGALQYVPPGTASGGGPSSTSSLTHYNSKLSSLGVSDGYQPHPSAGPGEGGAALGEGGRDSVVGRAQGLSWQDLQQPQLEAVDTYAASSFSSALPEPDPFSSSSGAGEEGGALSAGAAGGQGGLTGGDSMVVEHLRAQRLKQQQLQAGHGQSTSRSVSGQESKLRGRIS